MKKLFFLALVFMTGITFAQKDSIQTNQLKHFIKVNPFQVGFGEATLYYEHRLKDNLSIEGSIGYVFFDIYDKDSNTFQFKRVNTNGINGSIAVKIYNYSGMYLESQFYYKRLVRDSISKIYNQPTSSKEGKEGRETRACFFPYEQSVCGGCDVIETDVKQVYAFQLLLGSQNTLGKTFTYDIYGGVGFRVRVFDISIHQIEDWEVNHTFTFDNYNIRVYQYYPIIHVGLRIGFGL